ncbi:FbpB family small basic protein [Anaerobacillus sp. MEB173]
MRRIKKMSFDELVNENKKNLLKDRDALDKIEQRIEDRRAQKL